MKQCNKKTILAIETSCDDTCIAIINSKQKGIKFEILANIVSSQIEIHKKYGGVYPTLAKREHERNLPLVLEKALRQAKMLKNPQSRIDAIAVTVGPGLEPCLWTGVNFAKALSYFWSKARKTRFLSEAKGSYKWNLPIIPVNHIEGHILANFVGEYQISDIKCQIFPAICLVVSGGHTQIILMRDIGKYKILGETRDDAAGECLDKVARILGLGYPGGPAIVKLASQRQNNVNSVSIVLPRPMIYSQDYNFSFSGLKTAVLYHFKSQSPKIQKSKQYIQAMCAEVQQAVIDVLLKKTIKATRDYRAKTIILGGGVAANEELRKQFQEKITKEISHPRFLVPDSKFCTDNAAMIGVTGCCHCEETKNWKDVEVNANLRVDQKCLQV